jgi:hypothetical protein
MSSQNMWTAFDEVVNKLTQKVTELDEVKTKLKDMPSRLGNIKSKFDTIMKNSSELSDQKFRKEIETKVNGLTTILNNVSKTKTEGFDPIVKELEKAVSSLLDQSNSSQENPESALPVNNSISTGNKGSLPAPALAPAPSTASATATSNGLSHREQRKARQNMKDMEEGWNSSVKIGGYLASKKYSRSASKSYNKSAKKSAKKSSTRKLGRKRVKKGTMKR